MPHYEDATNEEEKQLESPTPGEQEEVQAEEPAESEGPPQPGKIDQMIVYWVLSYLSFCCLFTFGK